MRNGTSPRSYDLTLLDYFLWGYVKSLVYADKPRTVARFKDNTVRIIHEIEPQLCEKIIENWVTRIRAIQRNRGGHLNDIVFHT